MEVYAKPVLDRLDPKWDMFAGRFYREHCTFDPELGVYVKDLGNIKQIQMNGRGHDEHGHGHGHMHGHGHGHGQPTQSSQPSQPSQPTTIFNDKRVVLVDNNPYSFLANPQNGVLVSNFYDDPKDDTLQAVIELLQELDTVEDVRPVLHGKFGLQDALREVRKSSLGSWK